MAGVGVGRETGWDATLVMPPKVRWMAVFAAAEAVARGEGGVAVGVRVGSALTVAVLRGEVVAATVLGLAGVTAGDGVGSSRASP